MGMTPLQLAHRILSNLESQCLCENNYAGAVILHHARENVNIRIPYESFNPFILPQTMSHASRQHRRCWDIESYFTVRTTNWKGLHK
jgi:hypothetical protein